MDKRMPKDNPSQELILYKLDEIKEDMTEMKTAMKDVQTHILYMRTLGKVGKAVGNVSLRVGGSAAVIALVVKVVQTWLSI